jgi:cell division protein FtsB
MARIPRRGNLRAKAPKQLANLGSRLSWQPSTMVTVGCLVLGVFIVGPKVGDYFAMQTQIVQLKSKLDYAKKHLVDLSSEKKRWDDPVYIRSQARNRLFYAVPGEVSYLVLDANGLNLSDTTGTVGAQIAANRNSGSFSQSIGTTKKDWAKGLLQSVVQAGLDQPVDSSNKPSASGK